MPTFCRCCMRQGKELFPSVEERVSLYRRFYSHMRSHFGDDAMGKRKVRPIWG